MRLGPDVLNAFREKPFLNAKRYTLLLASLAEASRWQEGLHLMVGQRQEKRSWKLDGPARVTELKVCGRGSLWRLALLLLVEGSRGQKSQSVEVWGGACGAMQRASCWRQALDLLESMPRHKIQPNIICLNSVLGSCTSASAWQYTMALFYKARNRRTMKLTTPSLLAALDACSRAAQWEAALFLLVEAPKLSVRHQAHLFNAALKSFQRSHELPGSSAASAQIAPAASAAALASSSFLTWMESLALAPDEVTLGTVVGNSAAALLWEEGLSLLQDYSHRGLASTSARNALMTACEASTQWPMALSLLSSGLGLAAASPTDRHQQQVSCAAALTACRTGSFWEGAIMLLDQMRISNVPPNEVVRNAALGATAAASRWELTMHLARSYAEVFDAFTESAVVSSLCAAGQWQLALLSFRLFNTRNDDAAGRLLMSLLGAPLLEAYLAAGAWPHAVPLLIQQLQHLASSGDGDAGEDHFLRVSELERCHSHLGAEVGTLLQRRFHDPLLKSLGTGAASSSSSHAVVSRAARLSGAHPARDSSTSTTTATAVAFAREAHELHNWRFAASKWKRRFAR